MGGLKTVRGFSLPGCFSLALLNKLSTRKKEIIFFSGGGVRHVVQIDFFQSGLLISGSMVKYPSRLQGWL